MGVTPAGSFVFATNVIHNRVVSIDAAATYLVHNDPSVYDGLGDLAFFLKYRLFSANEEHDNYILNGLSGLERADW